MPVFSPGDIVCDRFIIDELAGAGGMSEVYRGRDAKLDSRVVAIKVLQRKGADSGLQDAATLAEIRSLSRLTHPNIAVLYDVCHHDGTDVIVMECLEGKTLGRLLEEGPLPLNDVRRYARQMADALACAHRAGVIHGDVKPSNIVVTSQGVKLVDFGLSRLVGREGRTSNDAGRHGIVGSPFYLSPEQATGQVATRRSDIFAFGLVVSQMITGFAPQPESVVANRAFVSGVLQQIGPRSLRLILERCLAPEPEQRWEHAGDVRFALDAIDEGEGTPARTAQRSTKWLAWAIGGAATAALLLAVTQWPRNAAEPLDEYQFSIVPPEDMRFLPLETGGAPSVSPDGRTLALVASDRSGQTSLWIRKLDSVTLVRLNGSEGATHPFWSPDGRGLGFFASGKLVRSELTGGPPVVLADAPQGRGASWSREGVIVFSPRFTDGLYRVSAEGGRVEPITERDFARRETSHRWPVFLPDGRRFLYFIRSDNAGVQGLYLGVVGSTERTRIGEISSSAVFAPTGSAARGHLIFKQDGFLVSRPFDIDAKQLSGDISVIATLPLPEEDTSLAGATVSNNRVLAYGGGNILRQTLEWVDRSGNESRVVETDGTFRNPILSPDRQKIAIERLEVRTGLARIWLFDLNRSMQHRFVNTPGAAFSPIWSPDGRSLLFAAYRESQWDLMRQDVNDASVVEVLRTGPLQAATDWSADGRWIIYQERGVGADDQWDIGTYDTTTRQSIVLLATDKSEHQAQLSPNGTWLAYTSDDAGSDQVYIRRFPSMTSPMLISTTGGSQPRWQPDGMALFYISDRQKMMSVEVDTRRSAPLISPSRELFTPRITPPAGILSISNYDVDSRDERFLVVSPPQISALPQRTMIVVNWAAGSRPDASSVAFRGGPR